MQQAAQFLRRAQLGQCFQALALVRLQAIAQQPQRRAIRRHLVVFVLGDSRRQRIAGIQRGYDGPAPGFGSQVDRALALKIGSVRVYALFQQTTHQRGLHRFRRAGQHQRIAAFAIHGSDQ